MKMVSIQCFILKMLSVLIVSLQDLFGPAPLDKRNCLPLPYSNGAILKRQSRIHSPHVTLSKNSNSGE